MQNNSILFKNIEVLGEKYIQKCLSEFDNKRLESDWWEALKFFFWHSFMRGRRDELSERYEKFAIDGIKDYFNINESNVDAGYFKVASDENKKYYKDAKEIKRKKRSELKKDPEFTKLLNKNPIVRRLFDESKERKIENKEEKTLALGNTGDIVMVLGVLEFITESENKKNIYLYLKNELKKGRIENLFKELIGIKYIGDKVATFIIRDIYLLNPPPELAIQESDYKKYAFPVDTWVDKIAEKLECKGATIDQTKKMLINKVNENKLDICKFAAGIWYLGSLSLDVLLDYFISKFKLSL